MAPSSPKNLLLTGPPGCGKSTAAARTAELLHPRAGGMLTGDLREAGRRVGFEVRDLAGQRGVLAHIGLRGPPRVSRYGVDLGALEEIGVEAILTALAVSDVVVIDEIGRMEGFSAAFVEAVRAALSGPKPLLATVPAKDTPLSREARARPDSEVIVVRPENRDGLPRELARRLEEAARAPA